MVKITELMPRQRSAMPSLDQLRKLRQLVLASRPEFSDVSSEAEMGSAFLAQSFLYRVAIPDASVYFPYWTGVCNEYLVQRGEAEVSGGSLMVAILSAGDVVWQARDRMAGRLLEVGLNQWRGRPSSTTYLDLLSGRSKVLQPIVRERSGDVPRGMMIIRAGDE